MDKPLRRLDRIMWDAEAPNSLTTISGMMVFKGTISKSKLIKVLEQRMMRFERFRRKVVFHLDRPHWHDDHNFELKAHIKEINLPGKGTYRELQKCISALMGQPLDYERPLWEVHIISNYQEGTALLWRLHHAVADGISLVKVIFSLTAFTARESMALPAPPEEKAAKTLSGDLMHLLRAGQMAFDEARQLMGHPETLSDSLHHYWETVKEMGELITGTTVPKSIYKGKLGAAKKAAWSAPLPLESIRRISKHYHTTVNDVLVAMVGGAVRKHLMKHGQQPMEGLKIVQPVSTRQSDGVNKLHNNFTWMSFDLPVHLRTARQRLAFVHERTAVLKPASEPVVLNELVHLVADFTPLALRQKLLEFLGAHIAGAITNIPGPRQAIFLAGKKVEDIVFWIPHTTHLGIGISLMSYDGKIYMGIVTDEGLINDPDAIVSYFRTELKQMGRAFEDNTEKAK